MITNHLKLFNELRVLKLDIILLDLFSYFLDDKKNLKLSDQKLWNGN